MIICLQEGDKHIATLSLPFPPREGDRIYLSYQELLAVQPRIEPAQRLSIDALKKLQDLDGTTWEVQACPRWELRFHLTGNYDPVLRVRVRQL